MRGTLLNTATVAGGGVLGMTVGLYIPTEYKTIAITALGLVTVGIGLKQFLETKNIIVVAISLVIGGCLGLLLGIHHGIELFSDWAKTNFAGGGTQHFQEALITTSVLFCVGPMTLLGCMQDALEKKIDLLAIKSTLDGIVAFFFAVSLGKDGIAMVVVAGIVLIFQGILTLLARQLKPLAENAEMLIETSATGGLMLVAIGFGLLDMKRVETASYLPALAITPLIIWQIQKRRKRTAPPEPDSV
ncbi:MAG: DUF554 domain-containing protein [Fimbriimonadaceae bacterium]|nr:DUF554 domain-containing protein [Fimbriimonadaceae bacterium]